MTIEPWFQHETLEAHLYQDEPFVADGTFKDFLSDESSAHGPPTELLSLSSGYLEKLDITDQLRETWFHGLEAVDEDYEIALLLAHTDTVSSALTLTPTKESTFSPRRSCDLMGHHYLMVIRSYQMVSYPNPSSRSVITTHCVPYESLQRPCSISLQAEHLMSFFLVS